MLKYKMENKLIAQTDLTVRETLAKMQPRVFLLMWVGSLQQQLLTVTLKSY